VVRLGFGQSRLIQQAPVTGGVRQGVSFLHSEHTVLVLAHIGDLIHIAVAAGDLVARLGLGHDIRLCVVSFLSSHCHALRLRGSCAGIRLIALNLDTAVGAVPMNIETNRLADIAEHHIVVAVDSVCGHLHFLTIDKEPMAAQLSNDAGRIGHGAAKEHGADQKTGDKGSDSLHFLSPHQVYSSHSLRGKGVGMNY